MIILSLRLSHLYNTMTTCFKNVDAKIFHRVSDHMILSITRLVVAPGSELFSLSLFSFGDSGSGSAKVSSSLSRV